MWSFLARLKERKLAHWGIAYLAGAWFLLQVLDYLAETFAWPVLVPRVATVLAGVGFLAALILAWYHGEKGAQKVSAAELVLLAAILIIAGVAVAFVGGDARRHAPAVTAAGAWRAEDARRVLVLPFENGTGEAAYASLGNIVADWITEALFRSGFVEAVDLQMALQISSATGDTVPSTSPQRLGELAEDVRAGTLVVGRYYRDGEELLFSARIARADGTIIEALPPVHGPAAQPTMGVAALRERVISALATHHDARLRHLEGGGSPPTFAAYEAYVEGLRRYYDGAWVEAAGAFDRALVLDSTFLRAAIWSLGANLIALQVERADSAAALLERSSALLAPYDLHHFRFFQAALSGDHVRAYAEARAMMEAAPGSQEAVREAALSASRTRRPREALLLLGRIDFSRGLLETYEDYWPERVGMELATGDTAAAWRTAQDAARRLPGDAVALRSAARVHAAAGRAAAAEACVDSLLLQSAPFAADNLLVTYLPEVLDVGVTLLQTAGPPAGQRLLKHLLEWLEASGHAPTQAAVLGEAGELEEPQARGLRAEVLYLLGDTTRARAAAVAALPYPEQLSYLPAVTVVAALAARAGDTLEASRWLRKIDSIRYWPEVMTKKQSQARVHALLGHVDRAAAVASTTAFNDLHPDFNGVRGSAAFRAAIRPK